MNESVPPISVCGITKCFDGEAALSDVSLDVGRGQVLGLLGKNGAGKTTLIKCALGLLRPDAGQSLIGGDKAQELTPGTKARLGYVPQEPTIYPWMKVGQAIAYHGAFYPNWNEAFAASLLQRLELDTGKRVGALSVGQHQKLAILLALGPEPDILLLDEPVAALDPAARRDFLKMILDIVANGERTVLLSTHITSDVERVCSHVSILRTGRVMFTGELDALKDEVKRVRLRGVPETHGRLAGDGILRCETDGGNAVLIVRGDVAEVASRLRHETGAETAVEDLNLEDIFLELHHDTAA